MMLSNRQLFQQYLAPTSDSPLMLEIERAEGVYMYGSKGKQYIDLISGISVSNLGHRHPQVLNAIQEQLEKYMHLMVYGEYVQAPQVRLADALTRTLPEQLNSIYLVNSGSEAIEGALKLAKKVTGRAEIISAYNSYHGSSHGALSVGGSVEFKKGYHPLLPGIRHIRFGNRQDLELIGTNTAAVLLETVQGEAGVVQADQGYFEELKQTCQERGALLILDEIQAGFGRTGKFWAFEHYDIVPDILVTAKGMGGGMPIGGFISSKEFMTCLSRDPILGHITTFGGHPVSAAASLACVRVLTEGNLISEVQEKADLFRQRLSGHPLVREFRQKGFLMALELESYEVLKPIIDRGIERGVVTDWFLYNDRSMRIAPPLIITEEEIHFACDLILEAMG